MKIKTVNIENFRAYREKITIDFNKLTLFVGKNDIGKSTILEALDLFFNEGKGVIKLDSNDCSIHSDLSYTIEVTFDELPDQIILDSSYKTNLKDEYLLNGDGDLVIRKIFNGKKVTNTYIIALHPSNTNCSEIITKKISDLKKIIKENSIPCDNQSISSVMRKAIWNFYQDDLRLTKTEIDVTKGDDVKSIWSKLYASLPVYSLFKSDRENSDGDKIVQDPLKLAVNQFLQDEEIIDTLNSIAAEVTEKLQEVSNRTMDKLREMDPEVASTLNPVLPKPSDLKWADVFKQVSISGDDDIPINKRGSGVKRLVLLNFFRAEAERRLEEGNSTGVIYAIEEPETAQHFANQRLLASALYELSKADNTQVILTTHSGVIVKEMNPDDLRVISQENNRRVIKHAQKGVLPYLSLNEINFTAFDEATDEYHDELWGEIESNGWREELLSNQRQLSYIREQRGNIKHESHGLSLYVRDVMHHPENRNNPRYTYNDLIESIGLMRAFLEKKKINNVKVV